MNLFDKLVQEALEKQSELSPLKIVVEKELLHHDIFKIMRDNNFLDGLTFIGGTCLRACYGAERLSEDLDFTGGKSFSKNSLATLGNILKKGLEDKYGLVVIVSEPTKEEGNTDTWKIKIETRPENKSIKAQRINIDICSLDSYDKKLALLSNHYAVDMGTTGLIVQAESAEEIYADKLIAFALRPNRIQPRDVWDLYWLNRNGYKPSFELIPYKIRDRGRNLDDFIKLFYERMGLLKADDEKEKFKEQMNRFLPSKIIDGVLNNKDFWNDVMIRFDQLDKHLKDEIVKIDICKRVKSRGGLSNKCEIQKKDPFGYKVFVNNRIEVDFHMRAYGGFAVSPHVSKLSGQEDQGYLELIVEDAIYFLAVEELKQYKNYI